MRQFTHSLTVSTRGKGFYMITAEVSRWLAQLGIETGLLTVFLRHTSASLVIQENADPDVVHDLEAFFSRVAPEDERLYRHTTEGPDDMPAHIRAALTQTQLSIPVAAGQMVLGTWQGIYLFEHRRGSQRRQLRCMPSGSRGGMCEELQRLVRGLAIGLGVMMPAERGLRALVEVL